MFAYCKDEFVGYHLSANQAWDNLAVENLDAVELLLLQFVRRAGETVQRNSHAACRLLPSIMVYIGTQRNCGRRVTEEAMTLLGEWCRLSEFTIEDKSIPQVTSALAHELEGPLYAKAAEIVIALLRKSNFARTHFVAAGLLSRLVALLEKTSFAAAALGQFSIYAIGAVLATDGAAAVVQCLISCEDKEIKVNCATTLRMLLHGLDGRATRQVSPYIPGLLSVLQAHPIPDAIHAVGRLAMTSSQSELLAAGALQCLSEMLLLSYENSLTSAAVAGALANLCHGAHQAMAQETLNKCDGIPILTQALKQCTPLFIECSQKYSASISSIALALANAVRRNPENQKQAVASGVISPLVEVLAGGTKENKVLAPVLGALLNLIENSPQTLRVLRDNLHCPQVFQNLAVNLKDDDIKEYLAKLLSLVVDRCRPLVEQQHETRRRVSEPTNILTTADSYLDHSDISRRRVVSDTPIPSVSLWHDVVPAAGLSSCSGYQSYRRTQPW